MYKVIVVGDIHGDWPSLNRLMQKKQPDLVLCCGDFGWWPSMEVQRPVLYGQQSAWLLKGLKVPEGCTVMWCDGNHEDHEGLESMGIHQKEEVWCYEGVVHKPRGTTHELPNGQRILFFGGAASIDKELRTPGFDWFHQEIPTQVQLDRALSAPKCDIVVSHTCPTAWTPDKLPMTGKRDDSTRLVLQDILEYHKPTQWFHGHWHKEGRGEHEGCKWMSLDYPKHGGRWWIELLLY